MKKLFHFIVAMFILNNIIYAATSLKLNYQGYVEENGLPVTRSKTMEFKIYNTLTSGTLLWESGPVSITPARGIFNYQLTSFPDNLFDTSPMYMEVKIDNDVLYPREEIVASAFAISAKSVPSLSEKSIINLSTNPVDWTQLKSVPEGFADGIDNTSPGASSIGSSEIIDGTVINDDISSSAGISYSKLNLVGQITITDINTSSVSTVFLTSAAAVNSDSTVNSPANVISWNQIKNMPADFADGVDAGQSASGADIDCRISTGIERNERIAADNLLSDSTKYLDANKVDISSPPATYLFKNEPAFDSLRLGGYVYTFYLTTNTAVGTGDMLKSVYDTGNNGIVDNSEKLGTKTSDYFQINLGTPTWKSADSDKWDGVDSTATFQVNLNTPTWQVANSAQLGGKTSSYFQADLSTPTWKAADSDKWDGVDSTATFQVNLNTPTWQVANSAQLGGKTSSYFQADLSTPTWKAADSDKLGGYNYTKFGDTDTAQSFSGQKTFMSTTIFSSATFSGNVGIGTTNPGAKLDVQGDIILGERKKIYPIGSVSNDWQVGLDNDYNFIVRGYVYGTRAFQVQNQNGDVGLHAQYDGKVGIGATAPTTKFVVTGGSITVTDMPSFAGGTALYANGSNQIGFTTSSRRYKDNIKDLETKPADVLKLRPVEFRWKETGEQDTGLIAEETADVIKDLAIFRNGRPDAVKYEKIGVYLLVLAKEQQNEIDSLKLAIAKLEQKIDLLKKSEPKSTLIISTTGYIWGEDTTQPHIPLKIEKAK